MLLVEKKIIFDKKGIIFSLDEDGDLIVSFNGEAMSFEDSCFRFIPILEIPYEAIEEHFGKNFPYVALISAGLKQCSDYWASLALLWLGKTAAQEKNCLLSELSEVIQGKWSSQLNKQLAKKELKKIVAITPLSRSND